MKKKLFLCVFVLSYLLVNCISFGNAYCDDAVLNIYKDMLYNCKSGGNCGGYSISEIQSMINDEETSYTECISIDKYNEWIDRYNKALENKDYLTCLNALEQARKYSNSKIQEIDNQIQNVSDYLGSFYAQKKNYNEALKYYTKSLNISEKSETLYNVGWVYYKLEEYKKGIPFLKKAKQQTKDSELYGDITKLLAYMIEMSEYEDAKKNRKADDEYGFYQYYLSLIDVFDARDKLPQNKNRVIIAVIDDGVDINHPDFYGRIRTNDAEIPGDGIDNDNNGYVDDLHGWNFVKSENGISSPGKHGTMVAGVIAANINNEIGVSGIIPDVEIMPLTVFGETGSANGNDIVEAINYAIDNGANIINLSLVQEDKVLYNDYYDSVLKKANKKGIVIVASAGNGDGLDKGNGINTTTTKISPVCNESNKKGVIGVGSLTKTGSRSKWSNYGECVDFFMYGEDIYTTAVNPDGEAYARAEGTSFSAPIVSGIIGLGYNMFGQIDPNNVYDNLKNSVEGNIINAAKYLDNLSATIGELGESISRLIEKGFTIAKTPEDYNYSRNIRRDEAAKLFVLYANMFHKDIIVNDDDKCIFSDLGDVPRDLRYYVINACRYGLLNGKGGKFMPSDNLTNAQAITIFMRMYGGKKDENGTHYADRYFIEAYRLGLVSGLMLGNQSNYEKGVTRGEIAILLHRGLGVMEKK